MLCEIGAPVTVLAVRWLSRRRLNNNWNMWAVGSRLQDVTRLLPGVEALYDGHAQRDDGVRQHCSRRPADSSPG